MRTQSVRLGTHYYAQCTHTVMIRMYAWLGGMCALCLAAKCRHLGETCGKCIGIFWLMLTLCVEKMHIGVNKSNIFVAEISNIFVYFCVQNEWKIVRRWHQLTHLHIHIDWSRNVFWKFAKLQSVITSLFFNWFSSSFHCSVQNCLLFFLKLS